MDKEETTAEKSRRERRKESRLAKNASKHQSWLRHQEKSRAVKRSNNNSELKIESKLDQSVSPTPNETQVVKLESLSTKAKHETVEECSMSGEIGGSVGRKMKKEKDSHKSSKKRRVEKGMTDVSMAAQKDLEFERKLSKKLKVKEGKLRGMDDGLNVLLEGMSSFADLFGESEVPGNGELPKKRLKKSSSSKKHKLPKEGMEAESLDGELGPVETPDQDVAIEEVPDIVTSKKKHKKRKLSSQEQEDNVEDGTVCTVKLVESSGTDVASGDVAVEVPRKKDSEKYIPQFRAHAGNEPDEHTQIRRLVRRLLNKIDESKVESTTGDLSSIFQSVARGVASQIMIEETLGSFARDNDKYAASFAAFVGGMACLVGIDFSAKFMASFAKYFEEKYHKEESLSLRNFTLLLSYLYIFGVCSSDLIYDFLVMLAKRLTEIDASIICEVFKCCGMKIRADDPAAMKNFILIVQSTSNKLKSSSGDDPEKKYSKRMEYMLEAIYDIKNNKRKTKDDPANHTRIKKWLQKLRVDDITIRGLTWSKLLDPDKKGQWWLSGDVVSTKDNVEEVANKIDKSALETQRMLQLAAAQKMNTDARRAIFCIIMSGEDYIDAFEKLLRLELQGKQDRDIMRVLVECCLQEKVFNKYYTVLASKLCAHDKNHKFTLQFCLWDHFKELESMPLLRSMHLAKFVAEMSASFTLSLAVLKTVDLSDISHLTPKRIMHFRILFEAIFDYPDHLVWNIFTRIAGAPELESFRHGIEFFIKEYILKTNKTVSQKFKLAKGALNNVEGVLMRV